MPNTPITVVDGVKAHDQQHDMVMSKMLDPNGTAGLQMTNWIVVDIRNTVSDDDDATACHVLANTWH